MTPEQVQVGYTVPDAFTLMARVLDIPDRSQPLILRSLNRLRSEALCGLWRMKWITVPSDIAALAINPYAEYQQQARIVPRSLLLGMRLVPRVWAVSCLSIQIYDTGTAPEKKIFSVPVLGNSIPGALLWPRLPLMLFPACQDMELQGPLNIVLTNRTAAVINLQLILHIVEPAGG